MSTATASGTGVISVCSDSQVFGCPFTEKNLPNAFISLGGKGQIWLTRSDSVSHTALVRLRLKRANGRQSVVGDVLNEQLKKLYTCSIVSPGQSLVGAAAKNWLTFVLLEPLPSARYSQGSLGVTKKPVGIVCRPQYRARLDMEPMASDTALLMDSCAIPELLPTAYTKAMFDIMVTCQRKLVTQKTAMSHIAKRIANDQVISDAYDISIADSQLSFDSHVYYIARRDGRPISDLDWAVLRGRLDIHPEYPPQPVDKQGNGINLLWLIRHVNCCTE